MTRRSALAFLAILALAPAGVVAQEQGFHRLPVDVLDVVAPSEWVQGIPGQMSIRPRECRALPIESVRRRIIEVAVQEWAFFGSPVLDRANGARLLPPGTVRAPDEPMFESNMRRAPGLNPIESARVAPTIAGYWAVTPEGPGIVAEQNNRWNGRQGVAARWNAPWSAAFISWVMCEGGLGTNTLFRRAIAHRSYIDQAIRARDGQAPEAAYVAYDIGEQPVEPGDLLCTARRPVYRNLAERRREMGQGASSHCDIVVEVDEEGQRILAIGGNVLRSVSLKVLPALPDARGHLRPDATSLTFFAHLKLRADPIGPTPLVDSAILAAFTCRAEGTPPSRTAFVADRLAFASTQADTPTQGC